MNSAQPPAAPATPEPTPGSEPRQSFIHSIVRDDLAAGLYDGSIVTRFPPEPNGYTHVGHAKSICLNFGLAREFGGRCHLRFDDTNPANEDNEYVEAFQEDIRWLGFTWDGPVRFASDYFDRMYAYAEMLVEKGVAFVDSSSREEIQELRGTVIEAGRESPFRDRTVAENLDLLRRMKAGEFPDGSHVLRAKIDMASPNMLLRDPLIYRIKRATHHRTGDDWCIYPMYDFAHCLEDAFEGVTHSLCTLEFETNRALYDWVLDHGTWSPRPKQIEFARLALSYTLMSKRYLLRLIQLGITSGWDDPRMPTLRGMRRRGYTPEAIRALCDMVGVAKANSMVDLGKLEFCLREDLNHKAKRVLCVTDPLKVTLTNYPEQAEEIVDAPYWPHDVPNEGSRDLPFSRELWVERADFMEEPPKKWFRLAPGKEVRLRYAYVIRCDEVVRNDAGVVVELRCTYDPDTSHGAPIDRKVKGTIHWVSARHAVDCEVRLVDRLFLNERVSPNDEAELLADLNPDSMLCLTNAKIEPSIRGEESGAHYQFERNGYFASDTVDSTPERPVFLRTVTLKDSWAKIAGTKKPAPKRERTKPQTPRAPSGPSKTDERDAIRAASPDLAARLSAYVAAGVDASDADVLSADRALGDFFDAARAAHGATHGATHNAAPTVAKWTVNVLRRATKDRSLADLPLNAAAFGRLVALVDDGTISATGGKDVFARLLTAGGDPNVLVDELGLRQVSDTSALEPAIDQVLADNQDAVARYRDGKIQLIGFFVGKVMKATKGAANPGLVKELLERKLG